MKYTPEYWQEMADEIMDCFDFDKVHHCMVALDWAWGMGQQASIPEKNELRRKGRELLRDAIAGKPCSIGGFKTVIDYEEGVLSLEFIVETWDAYKE